MRKEKVIASVLSLAMVLSSVCVQSGEVGAAKKVALNKKRASVNVGDTVKLSVKNGKKKAKVTWKTSSKKVATIIKKTTAGNKASATIKGVKKGTAKITAAYKFGKKTTKLTCKVTVSNKTNTDATGTTAPSLAPATTAPVASSTPNTTAAPTATATPDSGETAKPSAKPTKKPVPTPTATPIPEPVLVNPYKLDLSAEGVVIGENGGEPVYNADTKSVDTKLGQYAGIIVDNPVVDRADEYKYVKITYTLTADNFKIYLAKKGYTTGQEGQGWSDEIAFESTKDIEKTVCVGVRDGLDEKDYIKGIKFFNWGGEATISIKDITFYMDGTKSKQDDFVATTVTDAALTIDGVADEDAWSDATEYAFASKVALSGGVSITDTQATVKFVNDKDNLYFFIDVADSSIDKSSDADFERDGIEILFDEDNCGGTGAMEDGIWTQNKDAFHYRFTGFDKASAEKKGLIGLTNAIQFGGEQGKVKEGIEVRYALTDKGYSIEAKIPFYTEKAIGDKVRLDLIVQDCKDGVRYNEYYLSNTDVAKIYWNNENADYATIVLGRAE